MGKRIIAPAYRREYQVPATLPRNWESPWEEPAQVPKLIQIDSSFKLEGSQYWNYIAISTEHFNQHGYYLNRAECKILLDMSKDKKVESTLLDTKEINKLIDLLEQLKYQEDKLDFVRSYIKPSMQKWLKF